MGKASKRKKTKKNIITPTPDGRQRESSPDFSHSGMFSRPFVRLLLIAAIGLVIYSNTFNMPFQFDDAGIAGTPIFKNLNYTERSAVSGSDIINTFKTRYIGYLSFALNQKINGQNVLGYHLVNTAIHIANAILVYVLVILTFRTPFLLTSSLREWAHYIALFAGIFFVSHPVQTEAVTYIVQRLASLATMFYLVSLVMYVKARIIYRNTEDGTQRPDKIQAFHSGKALVFYLLSVVSAVLAMKTKETAFTLPLVIALYEFMFFTPSEDPRRLTGFTDTLKLRLFYLAPLLLTMLIIPLTLIDMHKPAGDVLGNISDVTRVQTAMSRWDYLFTEMRVIVTYIRLLILPVNQNLDYDYPIYHSLFDPRVFSSLLFLLSIAGMSIFLLRRSQAADRGLRIVSFGVFWFFITLSVESSIIPISDVIFEHRVYLPSAGFFIAITTAAFLLLRKLKSKKMRIIVASFLVIAQTAFAAAAYARNTIWGSDISLWEDVVKKSPQKARGHNNLGNAYKTKGLIDGAVKHLEIAAALQPDFAKARYNLGVAYWSKGLQDRAIEQYQAALKLKPDYAEAHNNLGVAYKSKGHIDRAIEHYNRALDMAPAYAEAHNNLGDAYGARGQIGKAMQQYQEALRLDPDFPEAHNNLGTVYKSRGMTDKAMNEYEIALRLKPDFVEAHYNLGYIYFEKKALDKAREEFETVLKIKPDLYYARQMLNAINKTRNPGAR